MKKAIITIFSIVGVIVIGFLVVVFARTFGSTGSGAIEKMTPTEKAYLEKLSVLKKGMTFSDAEVILGPPDRPAGGLRPTWNIDDSGLNQIALYFGTGGLRQVRWMSIGRFIYEPALP